MKANSKKVTKTILIKTIFVAEKIAMIKPEE
jgi:hypothetical protein